MAMMLTRFGRYLFPAAIALNMYQATVLLILIGLFGDSELAAEIGIIQGAVVAVFMAFSGNARSLILADSSSGRMNYLLQMRLLLVLPLGLLAYLLIESVVEVPLWLILVLIVRRASEWLAELQISHWEKESDAASILQFLFLQGLGVMPLLALLVSSNTELFHLVLMMWSVMPMLMGLRLLAVLNWQRERFSHKELLPHVGSSSIVSVSVYVFRVIIMLLAGKALAGVLFSAFALGGMLSSLYTFALGPSLIARGEGEGRVRIISICLVILGAVWVLVSPFVECSNMTHILHLAIGFSLLGGGLMIRAQHLRLRIIQIEHRDVFVQDCFANVLLIASIPFAVFLIGHGALLLMFAWGSILNLIYYMLPARGTERLGKVEEISA